MSIIVEKAGILTTLQDGGRTGGRSLGINVNGPMDPAAAAVANILAGRSAQDALIEMHYPAPVLRFEEDVTIALAGADFGCRVDGKPLSNWSSHDLTKGSVLTFSEKLRGNRAYLAFSDPVAVEPWLGSRSTNLAAGAGGYEGRSLQDGDRLELLIDRDSSHRRALRAAPTLVPAYSSFPTVRSIAGDDLDELTKEGAVSILTGTFEISQDANRMGFKLKGPTIKRTGREKISSSVAFGTVQLLPDGQLIVLMADHQTSGGYPRVAHVITRDLPLLGQLGGGDKIAFHLVSIEEAERLALEFSRELNFLKVGCRLLTSS